MLDFMNHQDLPPCKNCGADLDRSDPQGNICTASRKYESSCNLDFVFEFKCSCEVLPLGDFWCCDYCDTTLDPSGELETEEGFRVDVSNGNWTPPSEIAAENAWWREHDRNVPF